MKHETPLTGEEGLPFLEGDLLRLGHCRQLDKRGGVARGARGVSSGATSEKADEEVEEHVDHDHEVVTPRMSRLSAHANRLLFSASRKVRDRP